MNDAWAGKYVGIPYLDGGRDLAGWDCLGLVRWVLREECGISIPSYLENYREEYDRNEIERIVNGQAAIIGREIEIGQEQPFDVAIFRGIPTHVAVVVEPGRMLNVKRRSFTCVERYYSVAWRHRLLSFWRKE